jgi:SNF2 family DNA or RNA helicase
VTVLYGKVSLVDKRWMVDCEPACKAQLKRVFARISTFASGSVPISVTPENSRNLLWFLQRYPMECDAFPQLEASAAQHVNMEQRLADLLAARVPTQSFELALPPREYQSIAAQMTEIRGGLLLADDVGLGKSISAICPMTNPDRLPALVVCPNHMPDQWVGYLARFAPSLRVHKIRSGAVYPLTKQPRQRTKDLWPDRLPDVIVINYHKLRTWADTLAAIIRYVVFDECQQLRSSGTGIYTACGFVAGAAQLRMGLSATPIYNYGAEFWNVVDILIPDALGEREEFIREWCSSFGDDGKARINNTELFGNYLRREGIMLRRTRKEVGRELPPLTKIVHQIESDAEVLEQITGDAVALARTIVSRNESFRGEQMQTAGMFEALVRQQTGIAKAPYVAEFVRILAADGTKVILFGWHHQVYAIWKEKLKDLKPQFFTGVESQAQKQAALDAFINGDSNILVMSLRSGAGVDGLQHVCHTVAFGELDWSPGVHEQCIGRPDRDGQKEPVIAYFLTSDSGSDPIMIDVLGVKREQIEGVRNPGQALTERIDTGENQLRRLAHDFLAARGMLPA